MSDIALDVLYVAIAIVFFAISAAFARGCDKLSREEQNG
jgi:hypothetical protein